MLIVTSLVVTLLNTGAIYLDSVIYGYYTYAYVFGKVGIRIVSGAVTAVAMAFVTRRCSICSSAPCAPRRGLDPFPAQPQIQFCKEDLLCTEAR